MATTPLDISASISSRVIELVQPGSDSGAATLRRCHLEATPHGDAWKTVIDRTLTQWNRDASPLEDDGIDPPSPSAIAGARELALYLRDAGLPPATRIVPTGDGGVAVEYESESDFISFETDADGMLEFFHLRNNRIVTRLAVVVPHDDH